MNKRGDIEKKDFGAIFLIYILLLTAVVTSTNITIPNPEPEDVISEELTLQNTTELKNITTPHSPLPTIQLIQFPAKVGEKVIWEKRVYTNNSSYKIKIPQNAQLVKTSQSFNINLQNNSQPVNYLNAIYETSAPQKTETSLPYGKKILIYSEEHYTNITATTQINFNLKLEEKNQLKIYWKEENKYLDFQAFDSNNDNLIDQIEWLIPHLSNQTFEIIVITSAQHLDENKTFIENIYNEIRELDNIWSPIISNGEYVRITFEKELDNTKDITVYPRIISGDPKIEIYEQDGTDIIAEFTNLTKGENKVYLTELTELQNTFDLKILDGSLEFDYIVDPVYISIFYEDWENQSFTNWTNTNWAIASDWAMDLYSATCIAWATCDMNTTTSIDTSSAIAVNVSFMYRDDDMDAGDAILYLNNSAGNWDTITNIDAGTLSQLDDTWNSYAFSTSDIQYRHSGFSVRFYASPKNNENYWIDNIDISPLFPGPPNVTLSYPPQNHIYTDPSPLIFNATITAESQLTNCSLWTNHTGAWTLNQTEAVTGTTNTTSFNITFPTDNTFIWNIQCSDILNQNDWGNSNRTVLIDRSNPLVAFISPTEDNDTIFSRNYIYAEISLTENNFKNITFSLYNSTDLVNQTTFLTSTLNINWTNLPSEIYFYNVTVYDIANNSNVTTTRKITLDTILPALSFIAPTENSGVELEQEWIFLNTTIIETNFKNITFFLYNSSGLINQTTYQNQTTQINFTSSSENKTYYYNATIFDFAGNYNSTETRNITLIDTLAPSLILISPENKTYVYNTSIQVGYTADDIHLDTCWYNLNSGSNITMQNCQGITINVADEQQHTLNIFANDTLGYITSKNITFFVNSSLIETPSTYTVQRGSVFVDGSAAEPISETSPVKAFVIHTVRGADNAPESLQVISNFKDPEEIIFQNYESGSGATVEYSLISGPNITVQRGTISYTSESSLIQSINQVNLSNSFIILNNKLNSSSSSENVEGFWTTKFTDNSTINFTRGPGTTEGFISYQVVSWQGTTVQSATSIITDSTFSISQPIPSTNQNKSFMIFSRKITGTTTVQDSTIKGKIKNSTTLEFEREGSSGEVTIESFTIESKIFEAQHGIHTHSITTQPQYINIPNSLINISKSFDIHSNNNTGAATSFATAALTQNIHNKTAIVLQKGVASGAGTTSWSAIEIIELDSPVLALGYPSNHTNFSTYTIPQFNFTVSDESEILNCSLYGNWSGGWHLNQTISTLIKDAEINFSTITVEPDSHYLWNIKCIDAYKNTGWNSINFTFSAFLPPTLPTVHNITQTSNDGLGNITFSWNISNHSLRYEIWSGSTITTMSYLTETTNSNYTDTSFAGQKRVFYQVKATNPAGQNLSKIFAAHLYELKHNTIKSKNWIAFPSNFSYLINANQTLNEIPQATSFTTFNSTIQSRVTCNEFSCPESLGCTTTNCNFKVEPGKGYEINVNTSLSQEVNWSAIGKVNQPQIINLTKNATSFGKNWITLYPNSTLSNAQELIEDIPNADAISRWNPETQTSTGLIPSPFPWIPGFIGNNFQLNLEEGYEVSITSSTQWTQS